MCIEQNQLSIAAENLSLAEHAKTKADENTFINIARVSKDGAIFQQWRPRTTGRMLAGHVVLKYLLYMLGKADDQTYLLCQKDQKRQNTFCMNVLLALLLDNTADDSKTY